MKLLVEISEGMLDELRTCKFPIQEAYRLCTVIENGTPIPEGAEILTKEAYSDLCLRASHGSKTGRWETYVDCGNHRHWLCSCCGKEGYRSRFCEECGAKMEGAEE